MIQELMLSAISFIVQYVLLLFRLVRNFAHRKCEILQDIPESIIAGIVLMDNISRNLIFLRHRPFQQIH